MLEDEVERICLKCPSCGYEPLIEGYTQAIIFYYRCLKCDWYKEIMK